MAKVLALRALLASLPARGTLRQKNNTNNGGGSAIKNTKKYSSGRKRSRKHKQNVKFRKLNRSQTVPNNGQKETFKQSLREANNVEFINFGVVKAK